MIHPTCNLPSDARTQCHLPQVVCGVCTRQSPDTTCCEPWAIPFRVRALSRGVPLQVQESSITSRRPRSLPFDEPRRTAPSLWERERFILVLESADGREVAAVQADQVIQPFVTSNAADQVIQPFFRAARLRDPTFTDYAQNRTWESQFPQASEFSSTSTIILEARSTPKHYRETWPEIPQSEQRKCPPRLDLEPAYV